MISLRLAPASALASTLACAALSGGGCARAAPRPEAERPREAASEAEGAFLPVDPGALTVTAGKLSRLSPTRFSIRDPGVRAELGLEPQAGAEITFVYLGPSAATAPLASGELRRQIGLKLRALDTCNLVYVMWHIEPSQGLEISVKSNPGQRTHAECGDHGYTFIKPERSLELPPIQAGQRHTLRATLHGDALEVTVDGVVGWVGTLPARARALSGPIGVRSDNGDFDVELRAPSVSSR